MGPGCLLPMTMWCTKSGRLGVFSERRCTRETAAAAPELTLSCSVKSIDDQICINFVRRRLMSSISENGRPIKVSEGTSSPRGRSNISTGKTDLYCRLETAQSDRLKPPMTWPSTTASKTTAVVIRDRSARVDLSRLLLSCTSYVPCFVPSYRCSCFLVFTSLDISSSRLMWVWMVRHLSRSLCLVRGTTCRLAPPLVLLPPSVHGQLWWVHRLVVLIAGVPAVVPREIKQSRINEQCARAASYLSSSRD